MSRELTSGMLTEIEEQTIRPFYLFEADFDASILRLSSTGFNVSWDSQTWLGNGWFLGLGSIRETGSIDSPSLEINLSGVSGTLIATILNYARQGLTGRIYLGMFDASGAIITDPFILYEGGFDTAKINDSAQDLKVAISYVSAMVLLKRAKEWRYTDQQQQQLFAGDKGFEFVTGLAQWTGFWGNKEKPKNTKRNTKKKKSSKS